MVRTVGPLLTQESPERGLTDAFITDLEQIRRTITFRHVGKSWLTLAEDAGLLRDALGVGLPPGVRPRLTRTCFRSTQQAPASIRQLPWTL
jgi:ATP-dependent Lhr-like helicase